MPFCTRPVYSRVLLFLTPCFGMFINLLFIDQKKKIWKGCRSMKQDLESLGLWLENWIWKVKREDDKISDV